VNDVTTLGEPFCVGGRRIQKRKNREEQFKEEKCVSNPTDEGGYRKNGKDWKNEVAAAP